MCELSKLYKIRLEMQISVELGIFKGLGGFWKEGLNGVWGGGVEKGCGLRAVKAPTHKHPKLPNRGCELRLTSRCLFNN